MTIPETIPVLHARVVTGTGGGPEKTILNSPRFLHGTRYDEKACYFHPPDDSGFDVLIERARARNCPLIGIPDRHAFSIATLRRTAAICREHRVVMWHGHDYKSNLFGLLLKRRLGLRLVTTVHGWVKHTRRTPLYYAIDRASLRFYELVVAVSKDLEALCLKAGVARERLVLIENGIDTEEFRPSLRLRPAGRRLIIGGAGRLSAEKGFKIAIAAIARLIARGHDVELRIAGEGEELAALRAAARLAGIEDRVRLIGFCKDMPGFLDSLDIFCLSSVREGLPNVVLEAMATGLPIVSTTAGGMGEFGRNGQDMLLVPPDDIDALASGLEVLIEHPAQRTGLGIAARHRAEAELSFRRRMDKMKAAYDRLLAGSA